MIKDYHNYVIKDGKFIGKFEEMYRKIDDPWLHGDASAIQYDIMLNLMKTNKTCQKRCRILDIGCGKGAFTSRLKENFKRSEILAVDISETAIRKAKTKYKNLKINFRTTDIKNSYKTIGGKFDIIVLSQVLWYILPEFKKIISYLLKNSLAKNGFLLINNFFYNAKLQKYGNAWVEAPEDMNNLIKMRPVKRIDIYAADGFDTIELFQKDG